MTSDTELLRVRGRVAQERSMSLGVRHTGALILSPPFGNGCDLSVPHFPRP